MGGSRDASELLELLDGAPALIELPADRPRPLTMSGRVHAATVPAAAGEGGPVAPAVLTGERPVAMAVAVAAAYVHQLVEITDIVVGVEVPAPGGAEPVVVPVRLSVEPGVSMAQLVDQAAAHLAVWPVSRRFTLAELLSAMRVEPHTATHPVYQIAVRDERGGAVAGDRTWPRCELTLALRGPVDRPSDSTTGAATTGSDVSAGELGVEVPVELCEPGRIGQVAEQVAAVVAAAVDGSARTVETIEVITAGERADIARWNDTATARLGPDVVPPVLLAGGRLEPDGCAVVHGSRTMTHAELGERAQDLARVLVERGAGPDVPVVVSMPRSPEMIVAVAGVLAAGSPYVPVDPAYPLARRRHMVADSGARLAVTAGHAADDLVAAATPAEATPAAPHQLELVWLDGRHDPPDAPGRANVAGAEGSAGLGPEDLGYVIYTSGSTGTPKGVALTQLALANLVDWQLRRPDFASGRRTLQFASLSFDVSFQEIATTLASGGTLVLVDETVRRDPRALLDHLVAHAVERVFLPFVALRGLAEASLETGVVPDALREVYTAGEQLVVDEVIRRFFASLPGCLLENQYGPSESHVVSAHRLIGPVGDWPALPPIGAPIANTELHVLDDGRRARPILAAGELWIAGDCLARGYLGRPDLTDERFSHLEVGDRGAPVRAYRTGDRARWLADGSIEFLGRTDHQVKFRGFRIEPGEVAAVLSEAPGVSRCVASVREVPRAGARLVAHLVGAGGRPVDLSAVHRHARQHLPEHMVPSHLAVIDELPLTPSGKVDTAALHTPSFDRSILGAALVEPRNAVEAALAGIWSELLGVDQVGVHDDFFDLGGDSLMAVELFARVADDLDVELPLGVLGRASTIAGIAALIDDDGGDVWRPLVPLRASGEQVPLFCVHGGSGNVASFPLLARALPPGRPVYALQWDGLDGQGGARRIEAMADRYLAEVRSVRPRGPYLLAGQCIGGLVARVLAQRLLDDGEDVPLLVMWDSPNLDSPAFVRRRRRRELEEIVRDPWQHRGLIRYRARRLLGRPTLDKHRRIHGRQAMVAAAWAHRPSPLPVRTIYASSGVSDATDVALSGEWTDGALGWAHLEGEDFAIVRVDAGHNDVPYHPAVVDVLVEELAAVDGALSVRTGRGGG